MKTLTLASAVLFTSLTAYAQNWTLDKSQSKVGFTYLEMMLSKMEGSFKVSDCRLTASNDDLSDVAIELTADVNSVATGQEARDAFLKSPEFFDGLNFPTITFKSTSLKTLQGGAYELHGNLTIRGVTKSVVIGLLINGPSVDAEDRKKRLSIMTIASIKRSDFGLGTMPASVVSDKIELVVSSQFTKDRD